MSTALHLKETIPLVVISPYQGILGKLIGGIKITKGSSARELIRLCPPGEEKMTLGALSSLPYGIVELEKQGDHRPYNLQVTKVDWENPIWYTTCLDLHGNEGIALMKMSNIACDALIARESGTQDRVMHDKVKLLDGTYAPLWGPLCLENVGGISDSHPIYVTFPDVLDETNKAEVVDRILRHRDYAYDRLLCSMSGIMSFNIGRVAKRKK